jgi:hypothetical protein
LKNKIFVDTNVLVAASVRVVLSEQSVDVKHLFFDVSTPLFLLVREHIDKRIGVVTERIETEAHNVIERAVMNELQRAASEFSSLSAVLDICTDNLRRFLQCTIREPVEQDSVDKWFVKVCAFFALQKERMELVDRRVLKSLGKERAEVSVSKRFRAIGEQIRTDEVIDEFYQLTRLKHRPVKRNDMWILSEAAYLKEHFEKETPVRFYIASCDQHLSPVLDDDGYPVSTKITAEIGKEFGIQCDWPDRIAADVRKFLPSEAS